MPPRDETPHFFILPSSPSSSSTSPALLPPRTSKPIADASGGNGNGAEEELPEDEDEAQPRHNTRLPPPPLPLPPISPLSAAAVTARGTES